MWLDGPSWPSCGALRANEERAEIPVSLLDQNTELSAWDPLGLALLSGQQVAMSYVAAAPIITEVPSGHVKQSPLLLHWQLWGMLVSAA